MRKNKVICRISFRFLRKKIKTTVAKILLRDLLANFERK